MYKKIALSALLAFFIHQFAFAQSGWFWLNPLPQGNSLSSVSYVNNSIVYVSGYGGTLLKSTNGGTNFTTINTGLHDNLSMYFINELTGFSPAGTGIFRTTTGGTSWQYFQIPTDYDISGIQYITGNSLIILLKKYMGNYPSTKLYKSTDLGESWNNSLSPDTNTLINSFHFTDQNTGYAVGRKWGLIYSKVYKTTNGGAGWDSIASNLRAELTSVFFTNPNTGYVMASTYLNKILKTTNGCISWDTVYSFQSPQLGSIKFFNENDGYVSGSGILKTTNGGSNWESIASVHRTTLGNINEGLGLSNYSYNFIYKTTNTGQNWTQITQGLGYDLYGVTFINENTGFTVAYDRIYKTTNSGTNWQEYTLGLQGWSPYIENIMFVNDNTGYAGIDGGRIAKTTNCGLNWKVYETGCYDHNHGMSFPSADTGYAVTKYGFYLKTTNGGLNWINFGQQNHYFGHVHFINNNTGFAGGTIYSQKAFITRTTNGGLNWIITELDSVSWLIDVCVSDENTWFAVGYGIYSDPYYIGFIFRSTDAGQNWNSTRLPSPIYAIHFVNNLTGYASSTGSKMYKTTNGGNSWFATECINASYSNGIYFINENTGFAVGNYGQIIKTTTGGGEPIGIHPVSNEIPKGFILHQNYPNPFNPVTHLRFEISDLRFVKLIIYDILGREITTLINEQLLPGVYESEWDGANFSSGVYFYKLTTGEYSETKKMVLMK